VWLVRRRAGRQTPGIGKLPLRRGEDPEQDQLKAKVDNRVSGELPREEMSVESVAKRGVTYVPSGEGKPLYLVGDLYTFKVTGEETNGALGLWEAVIPPQAGPPPHIHHREDESFYVLEGEIEFLEDERTFLAGAGSFVHIPRGTLHRFKNVGTKSSRALMMVMPAGLEKMFEEIATPATDPSAPPPPPGPEDVEKLLAVAPKYGLEIPPPV